MNRLFKKNVSRLTIWNEHIQQQSFHPRA